MMRSRLECPIDMKEWFSENAADILKKLLKNNVFIMKIIKF